MYFKVNFQQTVEGVETVEAIIEAESEEEAKEILIAGGPWRRYVTKGEDVSFGPPMEAKLRRIKELKK
jgi:hypothetical protein